MEINQDFNTQNLTKILIQNFWDLIQIIIIL